jgi:hypothetical protein
MDIEIDKNDFDFLVHGRLDGEIIESLKKNNSVKGNSFHIELSKETIERILDFLSNELAENGFDKENEPNSFGIMIENLTDKFSRVFYS